MASLHFRPPRRQAAVLDYTLPFIAVLAATLSRLWLDPFLLWKAPFVFFILAILFSARFGGTGPGLLATVLSIFSGAHFFLKLGFDFRAASAADLLNLALFGIVGVAVSTLSGQLHAGLARSVQEEQKLRAITNSVPQAIWTAGTDGVCDFMSARWYEFTGSDPNQLPATSWVNHIHPDDLPGLSERLEEIRAAGKEARLEFRVRRHDGVYHWFDTRVVPSRDENGRIVKWYGSNTDVQDEREEKERFERIADTSPGVIVKYLLRPDGSMAMPFASPALRDIFGLEPGDVQDDAGPIFAAIHPEDRDRVNRSVFESARNMSVWQCEFRLQNPVRGETWVTGKSAPVRSEDGSTVWYGFVWDVTDRKRTEEAMRRQHERELQILETLVEGAPMGVAMFDRRMRCVQASRRWLEDAGLAGKDVLGKSHYEYFPNLPPEWMQSHRRGMAGETVSGREDRYVNATGEERWVDWQVSPWGDSGETSGGIIIYLEDVTARKRAEVLANKRDIEYRTLFENMPQSLAYCRMIFDGETPSDYEYLSVNPAFERIAGLSNVTGRTMRDLWKDRPPLEPELMALFGRVATTGKPEKMELYARRVDQWVSISVYSPERGHFVIISDVITGRRQAELTARQWQRAFEQSETGIAMGNAVTDAIEAVNAAYARQLGYSPEELHGRQFADFYPADERERRAEAMRCADGIDGHALFESRLQKKDGGQFPVMVDVTTIRDDEGKAISRIKIVHDLTGIRKAEAALREREQTVRTLLDSAAQAILGVDTEGRIVLNNRMAAKLFGYEQDELRGQRLELLLPADVRSRHAAYEAGYFSSPSVRPMGMGMELRALRGDGTTFPVEVSLSYIETQQGPLAIAFVNDITVRKAAEEEILQLNASLEHKVRDRTTQLESANRELESFSYSVSHDLRAPLRGIDGWSLALLEDYGEKLDERAQKYLGRVRSETQRMGMLIDDLLQLSRVTRSEMRFGPVDLSAIADRVAWQLREANPGRSLHFEIEPRLTARGDARLLEIALTNLLDNAVKFTSQRAEAVIGFGAADRDGTPGYYVRDNGVGFEMAYAGTLFGAFQRLHKVSEFPGTGIGLATVKRVVHRHGGDVWAEAELNRGATFGFTLGEKQG